MISGNGRHLEIVIMNVCCNFGVEYSHKTMKFDWMANYGRGNPIIMFILKIDTFFVNYSHRDDMSLVYLEV